MRGGVKVPGERREGERREERDAEDMAGERVGACALSDRRVASLYEA